MTSAYARRVAEIVLRRREEAERAAIAAEPVPDFDTLLHDKQRAPFEFTGLMMAILAGRQSGKSFLLAIWLIAGMFLRPGSRNYYFALTGDSAREIIWPEICLVWSLLGLDPSYLHEHTLTVGPLPSGSRLKCRGTDDRKTIETARGMKAFRVAIDEMGSQPESLIRYFVGLLMPTLAKQDGQIALAGTPGLLLRGFWHETTESQRIDDVPVYHWTIWDNPHIPDPESFVTRALAVLRLTRDSVTYAIEWLARWTANASALCYPLDPRRNGCAELPDVNSKGRPIDASRWRYVIGVDPAGPGTYAWGVVAAHPELIGDWVIKTTKRKGILISEAVRVTRELKAEFPNAPVVMDCDGIGASHAPEFTAMYGIGIVRAEKKHRPSAVRNMHDAACCGTLKVLDGPDNDALRAECAVLGWDKDQLDHAPQGPDDEGDHCCDTVLYGRRELHAYTREEQAADTPKTPEQLAGELRAAQAKRHRKAGSGYQWDR